MKGGWGRVAAVPRWLPVVVACVLLSASAALAAPLRSLGDLAADGRLGAMLGTLQGVYAERTYPQARLVWFNNITDLAMATQAGKVDAALVDSVSARALLRTYPDLGLLEDGFMTYPLGIGFRPDLQGLRERFDRFVAALRAEGRYATIHRRWFVDDPQQARMPEYPVANPREHYVLGVSVADLPYVAVMDNRVVGFDIEILQSFAAAEGIGLEIRIMDFGGLIPALVAGKVDIISDGIAVTAERARSVAFSAPYGEGRGAALALKTRLAAGEPQPSVPAASPQPRGWTSLADLAQGRIAVFTGTAQDLYASQTYPHAQIKRFNSRADLLMALKTGKADVLLDDLTALRPALRDNPDLAVLQDDFHTTRIGAAFRKEDATLRRPFDRFLAEIRADGILAAMHRRWMEEQAGPEAMPRLPGPETGQEVRVGVTLAAGLPFLAQANGEYIGFEMEMIERFALRHGLRAEIVPLEFDSLIAALAAGKIDMVVAYLSITPERLVQVDFSAPYSQEPSAAVILKRNLAVAAPSPQRPPAEAQSPPPGFLAQLKASLWSNFVIEQR